MNLYNIIKRAAVVAAIFSVIAAAALFLNSCKEKRKDVFPDTAVVQGVRIGGLSYSQAQKKLDKYIKTVPYKFSLTVRAGEKLYNLTQADFGYVLDYAEALEKARSGLGNIEINFRPESESVRKAVGKIAEDTDKKPVNAEVRKFRPFAKKRFVFKKEKSGLSMDRLSLYNQLMTFLENRREVGEIRTIVDTIKPKTTVRELRKRYKRLTTQKSVSYNTENATINMGLALKACNGSRIDKGETWSFNSRTGNTNSTANGYRKAEVILRKKLVQGVGGGICQASTTIFRAAVLSGMDIVERHNHHWASGYTLAGEDATIDYPSLDLKLKNRSSYPMFIESRLSGRTLEVSIYGVRSKKYDNIRMYSENYDVRYGESCKTRTCRTYIKKKKTVKTEVICTSVYSLSEYHAVRPADSGTYAV